MTQALLPTITASLRRRCACLAFGGGGGGGGSGSRLLLAPRGGGASTSSSTCTGSGSASICGNVKRRRLKDKSRGQAWLVSDVTQRWALLLLFGLCALAFGGTRGEGAEAAAGVAVVLLLARVIVFLVVCGVHHFSCLVVLVMVLVVLVVLVLVLVPVVCVLYVFIYR